jgi:hypothetical protein
LPRTTPCGGWRVLSMYCFLGPIELVSAEHLAREARPPPGGDSPIATCRRRDVRAPPYPRRWCPNSGALLVSRRRRAVDGATRGQEG